MYHQRSQYREPGTPYPQGYGYEQSPHEEDYFHQRGRSPYRGTPGFVPQGQVYPVGTPDGRGAPYIVQPSQPVHYSAPGTPLMHPITPPTTPLMNGYARGHSMQRGINPHDIHRSLSRQRGSRSRSRGGLDYQGVSPYYHSARVRSNGDIILQIEDHADVQIGTDRLGLLPYEEYLESSGYRSRPGGKTYCVIPAGTPVIFQDEHGRTLDAINPHSRRHSYGRKRPIVIEDEYGDDLAYMGDPYDRHADYSSDDDDYDHHHRRRRSSRSYSRGRSYSHHYGGRSASRVSRWFGVDSPEHRRGYGQVSSNVVFLEDDGRIRNSIVDVDGVHQPL